MSSGGRGIRTAWRIDSRPGSRQGLALAGQVQAQVGEHEGFREWPFDTVGRRLVDRSRARSCG